MAVQKKTSWLKWLVALIILGGGTAVGVKYYYHAGGEKPDYRTAVVARGDVTQAVTATGQLNPVVNVQVGSQVSGIISKLYVDYNSPVKEGQVIAQLDPATFKAASDQAAGDLASSKAALELASVEAKRAAELRKNDLIAQSDLDTAVANFHSAQANVQMKEAALERANVDLSRATIYSPTNGVVISRSVDVGQTVAASFSSPTLFIIANDLTRMQIDANVSEADVGGVEVNQQVDFTVDAFPYRTFKGKVIQIRYAPITVQNVVSYDTVVEVKNDDLKLLPGMTANLSIIVAHKEGVLKIPNSALRFKPADAADAKKPPGGTNVVAAASPEGGDGRGQRGAGGAGAGLGGAGGAGGGRPGGGGPGGPGGARRPRGERQIVRTIYVMEDTNQVAGVVAQLKPVQVKTGISDGVFTEITDGLKEGETVVVGLNLPQSAAQAPTANPFGGGRRF